jgi:formylglycine-generating enzyme required for sulfatase activity/serine/threonine protein kinase
MASLRHGELVGGKYRIEGTLGEGGMAVVHAARNEATGQPCAVKIIHARLSTRPELRSLFAKEVQVGATIGRNHHIVDVFDAGIDAATGAPYLVMELLEGETLETRLESGTLTVAKVAELIEQLADALDQAHEARVVHRDLKPGNLFLARDRKGRVALKVLDFGIAKALGDEAHRTATQLGTPSYAAPEQAGPALRRVAQAQGIPIANDVSSETDVWALGLITLEAITGVDPMAFWGTTSSADVPYLVTMQAAGRASERAGGASVRLPVGFDAWLARCLERDASRRWGSAGEAAAALRRLSDAMSPTAVDSMPQVSPTGTLIGVASPTPNSAPGGAPSPTPSGLRGAAPPVDAAVRAATELVAAPPPIEATASKTEPGLVVPEMSSGENFASESSLRHVPPEHHEGAGGAPSSSTSLAASTPEPVEAPVLPPPPLARTERKSGLPAWVYGALGGALVGALIVGAIVFAGGDERQVSTGTTHEAQGGSSATARASAAPAGTARPELNCPAGMTLIAGGSTFLGSPLGEGEPDEQPQRKVALPSFCLDTTEVTVSAYRACVNEGGCPAPGANAQWPGASQVEVAFWSKQCNGSDPSKSEHPVNCVDFGMAEAFCRHLGKRLPTEAEWEYAARGGPEQRKFPWGNDDPSPTRVNACGSECVGWFGLQGKPGWKAMYPTNDGFETTSPVGSFPSGANRWGVLDLAGNVWEWTSTVYTKRYDVPPGPSDTARVFRGGCWDFDDASGLRAANRSKGVPTLRYVNLGFRCARG